MVNRDRALQALQEEVDELRRRIRLLEQGGALAAAPLPPEPDTAAAAKPAPAAPAESESGDFVAARIANRSKTYHLRACYYAQKFQTIAGGCAFYPTRAAAEADGLKPCRRCANRPVPVGYVATYKPKGNKTFHLRSCRYSAPILNSGRPYREFANRQEAETAGHRPCERCVDRPETLAAPVNGA